MTTMKILEKEERMVMTARRLWEECRELRERRRRYKRYTYGRQWEDMVRDPDTGQEVTEGTACTKGGKKPLTNNLIRQLVKCVIGRFRLMREETEVAEELKEAYEANSLDELDCRLLEEFLISGCAIQRVERCRRLHGEGTWVDNVNPDTFFVNRVSDPRGWDVESVGQLLEMSVQEAAMRWAGDDRRRAREIAETYREIAARDAATECDRRGGEPEEPQFGRARAGKCRVIELWTLESSELLRVHDPEEARYYETGADAEAEIERENRRRRRKGRKELVTRWEIGMRWHGRYMAPDGTVLRHEVKAAGESHPYVMKLYPLIDGEVHSLVEDVVDQQKYVNRLITLIDHMMGTAAKGALLFPVNQLAQGWTMADIGEQWAQTDGLIPYLPRINEEGPKQLSTQVADVGAKDLLKLEMQLFHDVSGVSDALMGKSVSGALGAERYEAEVRNATVGLADVLETFRGMLRKRDERVLSVRN